MRNNFTFFERLALLRGRLIVFDSNIRLKIANRSKYDPLYEDHDYPCVYVAKGIISVVKSITDTYTLPNVKIDVMTISDKFNFTNVSRKDKIAFMLGNKKLYFTEERNVVLAENGEYGVCSIGIRPNEVYPEVTRQMSEQIAKSLHVI